MSSFDDHRSGWQKNIPVSDSRFPAASLHYAFCCREKRVFAIHRSAVVDEQLKADCKLGRKKKNAPREILAGMKRDAATRRERGVLAIYRGADGGMQGVEGKSD